MEYSARGRREEIEAFVRNMALEGMKFRNRKIRDLSSIAIEHQVKKIGATFAAVVLWDKES
jgi:arginine decarboxylase